MAFCRGALCSRRLPGVGGQAQAELRELPPPHPTPTSLGGPKSSRGEPQATPGCTRTSADALRAPRPPCVLPSSPQSVRAEATSSATEESPVEPSLAPRTCKQARAARTEQRQVAQAAAEDRGGAQSLGRSWWHCGPRRRRRKLQIGQPVDAVLRMCRKRQSFTL